jgi:hypothetical protein
LVGGLLVDLVSWRAVFLINIPLILPALYAVFRHVPESRDENAWPHFDWLGAAVAAIAVGGLSFGAIYGQQREWRDPIGFVALAVGAVATVAFPLLMHFRAHPLVPLSLFRSRNFSVTNVSTLLIYGALYVVGYYSALFVQGTAGYTAAAAGVAFIPASLLLALFSQRFGRLAASRGPRLYMAIGPFLMGLGVLWYARVPATTPAWRLRLSDPVSYLPPVGYLVDFLPASVLFGVGLVVMVAPLTTALMASVPVALSGTASAINNAISRVGPQLAGAVIFVAITARFYAELAAKLPGVDVATAAVRSRISPLNPPPPGVPAAEAMAAHQASTDAFHLAMLIGAALFFVGAAVNLIGIGGGRPEPAEQSATVGPPEGSAATA